MKMKIDFLSRPDGFARVCLFNFVDLPIKDVNCFVYVSVFFLCQFFVVC